METTLLYTFWKEPRDKISFIENTQMLISNLNYGNQFLLTFLYPMESFMSDILKHLERNHEIPMNIQLENLNPLLVDIMESILNKTSNIDAKPFDNLL